MPYKISTPKAKEQKKFFRIKNYKDIQDLQKEIRKNGLRDYFKVNGIIYTQEEYDEEGKEVRYANKRTNTGFIVNTKDRYNLGYWDAEIDFNDKWDFFRNDIFYID